MKRLTTTAICAVALLTPAVPASAQVAELGATQPRPAASCPDNCQAVGRVTGYQVGQGNARNPFQVRERGKIVAFSLTLGRPRADQIDYFNDLFGGPPRARISVLRPGRGRRNVLSGQSELIDLQRYFGSTPTFALERPLTVKRGYLVALTVPTWAPAFGVGLANQEAWRSSRNSQSCDDVSQTAAQQRRGSQRTYGCLYRTARLLYTAFMVRNPRATSQAPDRPATPPAAQTPTPPR